MSHKIVKCRWRVVFYNPTPAGKSDSRVIRKVSGVVESPWERPVRKAAREHMGLPSLVPARRREPVEHSYSTEEWEPIDTYGECLSFDRRYHTCGGVQIEKNSFVFGG